MTVGSNVFIVNLTNRVVDEMSDNIEKLKIFCTAAESESFKQAAIKLKISPQAVTRAIKDLEMAFDEILFVRSTRNVQITQYGDMLYRKAHPSIIELNNLFQESLDENIPIRITAPSVICSHFIIPLIPELKELDNSLRFNFKLSDNHSNVIEERIDLGVRIGATIKDDRFIARSLGKFSFLIVATPELLAKCGEPKSIEQLNDKPTVALSNASNDKLWQWSFANNVKFTPEAPELMCDDAQSELDAVLNHVGIGRIPKCLAQPYLDSGELIEVLGHESAEGPWDVFIYRPQRGPVPHRVRLVYDFLVSSLKL